MASFGGVIQEIDRSIDRSLSDANEWLANFADFSWLTGGDSKQLPLGLAKGDQVHVWHHGKSRWIEDGVVQDAAAADISVNGRKLPAGSLKVGFDKGTAVRWILPVEARELLHKVPCPRPGTGGGGSSEDWAPKGGVAASALLAVEQHCRKAGHAFTDTSFPISLGGRVTSVNRVQELTHCDGKALHVQGGGGSPSRGGGARSLDWRLFRGIPRADDVLQGELGDCWFLSSLAVLADFQEGRHVRALLPGQDEVSPVGAYLVRLCVAGQWRNVIVDDRLPCMGSGAHHLQLAYCVTMRQQLWASVIEKAFAKACGSYEAIRGGEAGEALEMLTGWPCIMVIFSRPEFDPEIFWATLCSSRDAGFLMTCSTKTVYALSLEKDHVYSLIDVAEVVSKAAGGLVRLLKIRNPHSKSKWGGAWSDSSSLWTPELRRKLGCPEGGSPHVFWMAMDDFLYQFAHCTICCIRSAEWHESRRPVLLPGGNRVPRTAFIVEASETTECSLSLVQPGERLRQGPYFRSLERQPLACAGLAVVALGGPQAGASCPAVASAHMRRRGCVSVDAWLPPGRYMVVPMSCHSGIPVSTTLACFSSRRVGVCEQELSMAQVKTAWAAYAKDNEANPERFHRGSLYIGKGEGGSVVVYAENAGSAYFNVRVGFDSEALQYSRAAAETSDWLAPGTGQILQICRPGADFDGKVRWRSAHKFAMTAKMPTMWHSPAFAKGAQSSDDIHMPFKLGAPMDSGSCIAQ